MSSASSCSFLRLSTPRLFAPVPFEERGGSLLEVDMAISRVTQEIQELTTQELTAAHSAGDSAGRKKEQQIFKELPTLWEMPAPIMPRTKKTCGEWTAFEERQERVAEKHREVKEKLERRRKQEIKQREYESKAREALLEMTPVNKLPIINDEREEDKKIVAKYFR